MTTDTKLSATPKRSPLLCAIEDDAMLWLDESSQKLSQLATLFETIKETTWSTSMSPVQIRCRIGALAELGRSVADDQADFAGSAHDRVIAAISEAKKRGRK